MAEQLTFQQKQAVTDRGGKLLVSAAAGSGKTKVLVDRLLSYLTDPIAPANIDEFLIITYTKAAAAELRGKIAAKLTEKIAEQPDNRHLQHQIQRLHLAKISTVHSFCADILREYSYLLDIPSDFRVADEDECYELQARVMQQILDNAYSQAHSDPDFCKFIDTQGFGRDDRRIPEIILKVYNSAHCHLDPANWLQWCVSTDCDSCSDVAETIWGKYLMDDLFGYLDLQISALQNCAQRAEHSYEMEKTVLLLQSTLDQLYALRTCKTWDQVCEHRNIDYGRLIFSKKITDQDLAEQIKSVRDACKTGLEKRLSKFSDKSHQLLLDYKDSMQATRGLISLVEQFIDEYRKLKQGRPVMDFTDLEHRTLDLLIGKSRSGATKAAREIGMRFREVMVDEYQDSNSIQDAIFSALTEDKQNCFMVGDVKQSIYQFRLADPSIFIKKYNQFVPADMAVKGQGRKVVLSSNFRSCGSVIQAVNDVFANCMSPDVGGLYYGEDEALHEGVPHIPATEVEVELYALEVQSDTYAEEASFVAEKISQLLDGTHMIRQGDNFRPIMPEDIVIILRSPGSVGGEYQYALTQRGIRCSTGAGEDLLQTEEVQTLLSLLQTINNPLQDIPLVATLTSKIFCFNSDELANIRSSHKGGSILASLEASCSQKVKSFLDMLSSLRQAARMNSISKLLSQIFAITRIDSIFSALDNGAERVENLQNFCKMASAFETNSTDGLNKFLDYISLTAQRGVAIESLANAAGAVTIMSIHKSKGLEFPVVFLCGLSRQFNQESIRAQVLCDRELGLGLPCVDNVKRILYPSIAKNAIAAKMKAESISEELRVLYVAMTRARDRLIMTYSSSKVKKEIEDLSKRLALSDRLLLAGTADCHGRWILMTAIDQNWNISFVHAPQEITAGNEVSVKKNIIPKDHVQKIDRAINFVYPYFQATLTPSKQTATQLKGRIKDTEVAENTKEETYFRMWRKPDFAKGPLSATEHGNAMHTVMQYISFENCSSLEDIRDEVIRIQKQGYLTQDQVTSINCHHILSFFKTDIGRELAKAEQVLREFKFSVLVGGEDDLSGDAEDKILLQGVVDCALLMKDGIHIVDFKTDRITTDTLDSSVAKYRGQVEIYAKALSKIFKLPIKSAQLYFFHLERFVPIV